MRSRGGPAGGRRRPSRRQPGTCKSASGSSDRDRLRDLLAAEAQEGSEPLWLVLIGHGTFDGRKAKFNLEGTDVAASELAEWLRETARPLVVINCASASGPFLTALSGPQRVLVTATKSGNEQNFARFGDYFSAAIGSPAGDLDRDGETSVLEAFLTAAHEVEHFYVQESRLATEHPLLDDNGDGRGTPADWFQGVRAVKRPQQGEVDGRRAKQWALVRSAEERTLNAETRARRDALEGELERLRDKKGELPEGEYWQQLEKILVEIAVLYREVAAVSEGER
jgi:hypothetical protein